MGGGGGRNCCRAQGIKLRTAGFIGIAQLFRADFYSIVCIAKAWHICVAV